MADRVLLTGISGFIGGHVALAALKAGYEVRGSIRDIGKADKVRETLAGHGADLGRLDFVALDLLADKGWADAARDCRFVLHTASPFVIAPPKDRDTLIRPAVEGTERALRAAIAADVERIVLTSSVAAVGYGHPPGDRTFTDADWTVLGQPDVTAYTESKTRAERRAWEIVDAAGWHDRLATINPALVLGPLLDEDPGTSATLVKSIVEGKVPALPRLSFGIVDVRDVAEAHVRALTAPDAGGRRFLMSERTLFLAEVAEIIRARVPDRAGRVPRLPLPDWAMRIFALFDQSARGVVEDLGHKRSFASAPAEALLGHRLIAAPDSVVETVRTLPAR
ncbi:dihydroflavonol-4-reductase [Devosia enhydra]|uniref:Dihydroflavonol-4-reductase n=1 Tax=Devosia enhydra TaxID=665118 RepID=A0A1K2HZV1_9HYPH|nr:aldehyde reductase [Devosia enhydra]SFZ85601.1 dihydroflavonol-4-reductase [Devosia enhydra]